jgi:hypothetical protein
VGFTTTAYNVLSAAWLDAGSPVGRPWVEWSWADVDGWAAPIHFAATTGEHYMRTQQPHLSEALLDVIPLYYLGQETALGRRHDGKHLQQLSLVSNDIVDADTCATVWIVSRIMGQDGVNSVTAGGVNLRDKGHYRLPTRIKGDTWYYAVRSYAVEDFPEIEAVRLHYRQLRPRGRNR